MNVTVESLFSPPEAFQMSGQQFAYVASLPLPLTTEVSHDNIIQPENIPILATVRLKSKVFMFMGKLTLLKSEVILPFLILQQVQL